jgi:hypothetical protein
VTGFPTAYTDQLGINVGPCDLVDPDPVVIGANLPPCGGLELVDPQGLFVEANIAEFTYYRAESVAGNNSRLRIEVQGGAGLVINGALIRLQPLDMDVAGDYTITTPLGVFTVAVADPLAVFNAEIGLNAIGATGVFNLAFPGAVQFFVPNGTGVTDPITGDTFLGDGITEAALTPGFGWPLVGAEATAQGAIGDGELVFRVETPLGAIPIDTPLFSVEGKALGVIPVPSIFLDVPLTHPFVNQVIAITDAGITGGCSATPPNYCPAGSITRGQMAVFIETSLGNPLSACTGRFADVPTTHPFCGFIERLAADGITGGCSATNFCPDDPITRGQMAVFIEAAVGNAANPCGTRFADVTAANPFCGFIDRLAADGITGGCTATNFCPNDPVSRGQMAVFIVAAPAPLLPDPPAPPAPPAP